jgi:hypothetical protein
MSRRFRSIRIAGIATLSALSALLVPAGREACAQQATLSNTHALDFGRIVASGAGTVMLIPGTTRPQGSGVIVLNSSSAGPATFTVGGNAGKKSVLISFQSPSIQLSGAGDSMTVDTFVSSPAANTLVAPAAAATVSVGATLHVKAAQQPGTYSGSFSLIVNFQ